MLMHVHVFVNTNEALRYRIAKKSDAQLKTLNVFIRTLTLSYVSLPVNILTGTLYLAP